ncbi:MAG TPA: ABC transporter permease [Haliangium sp.]|nr:ABC transporter permease [Haliangium sp.]
MIESARNLARGFALPVALVALWELVARAGLVSDYVLPAFSTVLAHLVAIASGGGLWLHAGTSALRVGSGFAAGALLGIGTGLAVGLDRKVEAYLDPLLQALRSVPSLAWVPLLLLWMGIDEAPKITLIAVGAFFPVYLNTVSGIRGVDPRLIEVGRVFALGRARVVWRIMLPASAPALLTGLRTGLGVAWLYVVAAELIAAEAGLGFMLTDGRELSRADMIFAAIALLASCGKLSDGVLKAVERRLLRWHPGFTPPRRALPPASAVASRTT